MKITKRLARKNMKSTLSIILFILSATSLFAHKEPFDLTTYTAPNGWKKNNNSANVTSYVVTDNQKGTYCQIGVYASTASKGSLQADFESECQELIVKIYKPTIKPEMLPSTSERFIFLHAMARSSRRGVNVWDCRKQLTIDR